MLIKVTYVKLAQAWQIMPSGLRPKPGPLGPDLYKEILLKGLASDIAAAFLSVFMFLC